MRGVGRSSTAQRRVANWSTAICVVIPATQAGKAVPSTPASGVETEFTHSARKPLSGPNVTSVNRRDTLRASVQISGGGSVSRRQAAPLSPQATPPRPPSRLLVSAASRVVVSAISALTASTASPTTSCCLMLS